MSDFSSYRRDALDPALSCCRVQMKAGQQVLEVQSAQHRFCSMSSVYAASQNQARIMKGQGGRKPRLAISPTALHSVS